MQGGAAGPCVIAEDSEPVAPTDKDASPAGSVIEVDSASSVAGSEKSDDDDVVPVPVGPEGLQATAAADMPLALDGVLGAHDPMQVMMSDAHAPLVTVSIEEQAFTPFFPLARVPYWESLLGLVRQGLPQTEYARALDPALVQAHTDLTKWLAMVVVSLFDPARLHCPNL